MKYVKTFRYQKHLLDPEHNKGSKVVENKDNTDFKR